MKLLCCKKTLESDIDALKRKHADKVALSIKRTQTVTIDDVIKSFCEVVKRGPAYVCTICHCLMYKQSVYPFQSDKFVDKFDNDDFEMLIDCEHVTFDGMSKGKVPSNH